MPSKPAIFRPHPKPPTPSDVDRPTSTQRGYSSRWQRFRLMYLKAHPLCQPCGNAGRTTEAVDLHHMDGKGPLGERGYDPGNILPCCHRCHSKITARERASQ